MRFYEGYALCNPDDRALQRGAQTAELERS